MPQNSKFLTFRGTRTGSRHYPDHTSQGTARTTIVLCGICDEEFENAAANSMLDCLRYRDIFVLKRMAMHVLVLVLPCIVSPD